MLRMGDGPVANLPAGLDGYAGYTDNSGIGVTFPAVVAKFPAARHLSIAVHGAAAMCADVESGAMRTWRGYSYGYCSVSMVNTLLAAYGRPPKLWTAHYDPKFGAHICSPECWPGLETVADGTQWTNHGGAWDESLLLEDFFTLHVPPGTPPPTEGDEMELYATNSKGVGFVIAADLTSKRGIPNAEDAANLIGTGVYKVVKLDDAFIEAIPG